MSYRYRDWIKDGEPEHANGKDDAVIRWWKTHPTEEQFHALKELEFYQRLLLWPLLIAMGFLLNSLLQSIWSLLQ